MMKVKKMTKIWPPRGFVNLIKREPAFIQTNLDSPKRIAHHEFLDRIIKTQKKINGVFTYEADQTDYWNHEPNKITFKGILTGKLYSKYRGDCEDYALAKYWDLVKQGVPRESLRLMLCRFKNTGQWHLVLGITTDARDEPLILDNRFERVYWMKDSSNYEWWSWSVPGQFLWERLE